MSHDRMLVSIPNYRFKGIFFCQMFLSHVRNLLVIDKMCPPFLPFSAKM